MGEVVFSKSKSWCNAAAGVDGLTWRVFGACESSARGKPEATSSDDIYCRLADLNLHNEADSIAIQLARGRRKSCLTAT